MITRRLATLASTAALALSLAACGGANRPAEPAPQTAPEVEAVTPEVGPDRTGLPHPGPRPSWAPPVPSTFSLENGIRVMHSRQGDVPLVSLLMVIPRGSATDPVGEAGKTYLMADLLDEGAGQRSALEISEALGLLATRYSVHVDVDFTMLGLDMIAENFDASVDLLADMVLRPNFDRDEFQRRKDYFIAQALSEESEPRTGRRVAALRSLFADGYAADQPTGTQSSLKSLDYDEIKRHYAALMTPEDVEFVVVGGIDTGPVRIKLEEAFGKWKGRTQVKPRPVKPSEFEPSVFFVDYPEAAQSVLGIVQRAPGADAKDYFPASVFSRALGEAFTSRINLNLREDKGYTYGSFSTFHRYKDAGYFGVFADVKTEVTRESIDEVFKELDAACGKRPITDKERDEAVGGLLLGFPSRFESIDDVGFRFASLPIYERELDWYQKWPRQVEAVTTAQANQTAQDYCKPADYHIVIAGDRAQVAPKLEGLGRPLIDMDHEGRPLNGTQPPKRDKKGERNSQKKK